jgi:hypothetical protein
MSVGPARRFSRPVVNTRFAVGLRAVGVAVGVAAGAGPAMGQCVPQFEEGPTLVLPGAAALAVVDLDLDSRPDIVAMGSGGGGGGGGVSVWKGAANGFGARVQAGVAIAGSTRIVAAGFSADGFPDVAVSSGSGVHVFKNLGGTLTNQQTFAPGVAVGEIEAADLNGDGLLDLVAACYAPAQVLALINDGMEGFFSVATPMPAGVMGLHLRDFNGDSLPDALVGAAGTGGLYRLTNVGSGQFGNVQLMTSSVGGGTLVGGQVGGDELEDLVMLSSVQGRVNLFGALGPQQYTLSALLPHSGLSTVGLPAVVDLSGDGSPELLVPAEDRVFMYENAGGFAMMATGQHVTGAGASQVAGADINLDGRTDLVVTCSTAGVVRILLSGAGGVVTQQPQPQSVAFGATAQFMVQVTSNHPSPTYHWMRNGSFLIEGGHYSGVQTPTLTVASATDLEVGGYECYIEGCGVLRTDVAQLIVGGVCGSSDFDGDGDVGTDADIEAFFRVLGGGNC